MEVPPDHRVARAARDQRLVSAFRPNGERFAVPRTVSMVEVSALSQERALEIIDTTG